MFVFILGFGFLYLCLTCEQQDLLNIAILDTLKKTQNNSRIIMRGLLILTVFFLLFVSASLLIPTPMFPGNVFCMLIGETISEYSEYSSAVFNGIFYGAILWLVFVLIGRRLGQEK